MSPLSRRLQSVHAVQPLAVTGNTLAQDSFDRADGSMGTADVGGAWSTYGSPVSWGVTNNMVALSGGVNESAVATLPVSMTEGTVFVDMYLSPGSANTGVCLLASADGSTYLNVQLNESSQYDRIAVSKRKSGTSWLAENSAAGLALDTGYSLAAVVTANDVKVYVDGVNRVNYTFTAQDKLDLTGSYVGLRSWFGPSDDDGGSRWDRFLVTDATSVPQARVPALPRNLTATNAGSGQATVTWQRPGNGGSALTGYVLTSSVGNSYTITDATATSFLATGLTNTGQTFTLKAVNAIGQSASTTSNSVTPSAASVPGAPTNVTASPGDTWASVSWTAPVSDGGSAITSYVVTSSPGNVQGTFNSSLRTGVINGLTNGTAYTFTVKATNAIGSSVSSAPSNSTTPVASGGTASGTKPTAATTGVPAGTTLTTWTGSNTISTSNIVIQDTLFTGQGSIKFTGANVTIQRCRNASGGFIYQGPGPFTIEDSETNGASIGIDAYYRDITTVRITRVHRVSGGSDGIYISNSSVNPYKVYDVVVQDCLMEGFDFTNNPTAHGDGIQIRGIEGLQILNTVFDMGPWQVIPYNGTNYNPKNSAIYMENVNGGCHNILIDTVWLNGGGYTFYVNPNITGNTARHIRMGRDYGYGPINSAAIGVWTMSDNLWEDNNQPIPGMN